MKPKIIKCLKCQMPFRSEGIHNRVCIPCKNSEAWKEGTSTSYSVHTPGNTWKGKK